MRDFKPDYSLFDGKSILVTGGTGSFGTAFIKSVLHHAHPRRLIVYSRDELKQSEMQDHFASYEKQKVLRFFIGDVRDADRLKMALRSVDYVVHAAALKQVPAAEYNPTECIRTNITGAENVVRCAIEAGVSKVVALSTDKAANPLNLYGATKLASDKVFVAGNNLSGAGGTRFSIVRYGNVVGSRGSVVPVFQKLIAEGHTELPITDPDMTRFWITLGQGVDLVVRTFSDMIGGEIIVPKIPSMKITDLATALLPDAKLNIIGIRPGEKMHEMMISPDDARLTYETQDYYIIRPAFAFWTESAIPEKHVPVPAGFHYSSDHNDEWLDRAGLMKMIEASQKSK